MPNFKPHLKYRAQPQGTNFKNYLQNNKGALHSAKSQTNFDDTFYYTRQLESRSSDKVDSVDLMNFQNSVKHNLNQNHSTKIINFGEAIEDFSLKIES